MQCIYFLCICKYFDCKFFLFLYNALILISPDMTTKRTQSEPQKKENITKLPDDKEKAILKLPEKQQRDIDGIIAAIESAGLEEFTDYIRSPWKMLWPNFVAGVARGFGTLVGAAIVIAIIGWFLTTLIDLPLIGKKLEPYVENLQTEISKYTEATNYKTDFSEIRRLLGEIEKKLPTNTPPSLPQ